MIINTCTNNRLSLKSISDEMHSNIENRCDISFHRKQGSNPTLATCSLIITLEDESVEDQDKLMSIKHALIIDNVEDVLQLQVCNFQSIHSICGGCPLMCQKY